MRLLILTFALLAFAAPLLAAEPFHQATSEAELALVHALAVSDQDGNFGLFLLDAPKRDTTKDSFYLTLVTKPLQGAIAAEQRREVKKNCGGHDKPDEVCGMDFNPLTCAQDTPDHGYVVTTIAATQDRATIAARWQNAAPKEDGPTYRLVKTDGAWKVDGITCDAKTKFNMK